MQGGGEMALRIKSCVDMSKIQSCDMTDCSYNVENQCRTVAITVGNSRNALCDTFLGHSRKGGISSLTGGVGACKMEACRYNEDFECSADPGIKVAAKGGRAQCATFAQR